MSQHALVVSLAMSRQCRLYRCSTESVLPCSIVQGQISTPVRSSQRACVCSYAIKKKDEIERVAKGNR